MVELSSSFSTLERLTTKPSTKVLLVSILPSQFSIRAGPLRSSSSRRKASTSSGVLADKWKFSRTATSSFATSALLRIARASSSLGEVKRDSMRSTTRGFASISNSLNSLCCFRLRIQPPNMATITRAVTMAINKVPPRSTLLLRRRLRPLLEEASRPNDLRRERPDLPAAIRSTRPRTGGSPMTLSALRTGVESRTFSGSMDADFYSRTTSRASREIQNSHAFPLGRTSKHGNPWAWPAYSSQSETPPA